MTIRKARKTAMLMYALACIVFLIRMLLPVSGWIQTALTVLFFALVAVGLMIGNRYCRCPYCGRGLKVGLKEITSCEFCHAKIQEQ